MTNFEKIKQMSIEEFAKFMDTITANCIYADCEKCFIKQSVGGCTNSYVIDWLNKEAEQ